MSLLWAHATTLFARPIGDAVTHPMPRNTPISAPDSTHPRLEPCDLDAPLRSTHRTVNVMLDQWGFPSTTSRRYAQAEPLPSLRFGRARTGTAPRRGLRSGPPPGLRRQLSTSGLSGQVSNSDVAQFTTCLEAQLGSSDPTLTPPGCPSGQGNDPISAAFTNAARGAVAQDFTLAVQVASVYALGAMALTVFLTSLLPRRAEHQDWPG